MFHVFTKVNYATMIYLCEDNKTMNILIAGGTGFIGRALIEVLHEAHSITVVGRSHHKLKHTFPNLQTVTWDELTKLNPNDFSTIIHLSGENIASSRWSKKVKQNLITSRVNTANNLVSWIQKHDAKPHMICANAIGIYGVQARSDSTAFTEDSALPEPSKDFLVEICTAWQEAFASLREAGVQCTSLRFGVVLKQGEGMLKELYPSFRFGLGAKLGDGQQVISWIHIDDLVAAIVYLLEHQDLTGVFNLTSPVPVTQAEFAKTFASVLKRPLWFTMPAWVVRLLFGEMGEYLLLNGQRVLPKRLSELGFEFKHAKLADALTHEFGKTS